MGFYFRILSILLVTGSCSASHERDIDQDACIEDAGSPTTKYDDDHPCDIEINCLYGGECLQIRIPSILYNLTDDISRVEKEKLKISLYEEAGENTNTETYLQQKCVCKIECDTAPNGEVCGTNGKTYKNKCLLEREACRCQKSLFVQYRGKCLTSKRQEKSTYDDEDSTWGSGSGDGPIMFSTTCKSGIVCYYGAVCNKANSEETCVCQKSCPSPIFQEKVFGSDGVWHDSLCLLHKAECEQQRDIYHVKDVPDVWSDPAPSAITPQPDPCNGVFCFHGAVCLPGTEFEYECSCDAICDQEFATSPNDHSTFRMLAAHFPKPIEMAFGSMDPSMFQSSMKPLFNGPEPSEMAKLSEETPTEKKFIMTNSIEEKFHKKKRRLRQRKRRNRTRNKTNKLVKRSLGNYELQSYPRSYINKTVCGTDGKTYSKECELRVRACHDKIKIDVAHVGACKIKPLIRPTKEPILISNFIESSSTTSKQTTVEAESTSQEQETTKPQAKVMPPTSSEAISQTTSFTQEKETSPHLSSRTVLNNEPNFTKRTHIIIAWSVGLLQAVLLATISMFLYMRLRRKKCDNRHNENVTTTKTQNKVTYIVKATC